MANTRQIAAQLSDRCGYRDQDAILMVRQVLFEVFQALLRDRSVRLRGYGKLAIVRRRERSGRNPQTGAAITIGEHYTIVYKPSEPLVARINAGYTTLDEAVTGPIIPVSKIKKRPGTGRPRKKRPFKE